MYPNLQSLKQKRVFSQTYLINNTIFTSLCCKKYFILVSLPAIYSASNIVNPVFLISISLRKAENCNLLRTDFVVSIWPRELHYKFKSEAIIVYSGTSALKLLLNDFLRRQKFAHYLWFSYLNLGQNWPEMSRYMRFHCSNNSRFLGLEGIKMHGVNILQFR